MPKETRARFRYSNDRKRRTNVSLSETLVKDAQELGINVSQACEEGLLAAVKAEKGQRWKEDNAEAIESWNHYVAEHGLPLAKYRRF